MTKDRHEWELLLAQAKVDHQQILTLGERALQVRQALAEEAAKIAA